MNQNIIDKYQIRLINEIENWEGYKEIDKSIKSNNQYLDEFLIDWTAPKINELLLPDFEEAMANQGEKIINGSETINIHIYNNVVEFYNSDYDFVSELPTQDFKEIVIGWRDFLLTPPLNGTKMS